MTKTVKISDEAYALLLDHMRTAGNYDEEQEMDELFRISDQVWGLYSPEAKKNLAAVRGEPG